MAAKRYDIVGIGEILVEVLAKEIDQRFNCPGVLLGPYPSGAPAICIDQAARMGAKCAMVSRIGADDFGRLNSERLQEAGVDTRYIYETLGQTTGTAFVTYFHDGERQFIYHFAHSAAGCLVPEDVPEALIRETDMLHIMGCSLTASDSMREAIMKAVEIARQEGVLICFDPNIRRELLNEEDTRKAFWSILSLQDILLTGKKELEWIYERSAQDVVEELLKEKPSRIIVLKDGSRGVSVHSSEEAFSMGTYPVEELDPTGAGDCFDGSFLAAISQKMSLRDAAKYANAAGAMKVTKRGPMEGNNRKEAIDAFLAQQPEPNFKIID